MVRDLACDEELGRSYHPRVLDFPKRIHPRCPAQFAVVRTRPGCFFPLPNAVGMLPHPATLQNPGLNPLCPDYFSKPCFSSSKNPGSSGEP